ncbi:MAG TPA: SRPBCC domain-containing protein [Candidatus Thermoplasmatota archaeon]|nr:SRPBCC domain-containing protein [Candidatus Thermoplasmatota archaeon]
MAETVDLVVTRTFDAPVANVWEAWTDARFVRRWWGVDGFSNILAKMDVREGGTSHVGMRASKEYGGMDYYNVFRYTLVVPRKLIQWTSNFADKEGNVIPPEAAGLPPETPMDKEQQAEFMDLGDGRTKVTVTERGWLAGGVMAERSRRGLEQTLANIERLLADPAKPEGSEAPDRPPG